MKFPYKERRTDTHVYFVGGPFSNWYARHHGQAQFQARLWRHGPEMPFYCTEQYMMAGKAMLFGDVIGKTVLIDGESHYLPSAYEKIISTIDPKAMKGLGREITPYDDTRWKFHARDIVFRGCWEKFTQNPDLAKYLLDTGDRMIVEGAWYDEVWGVKLAFDDPRIEDEANWRGMNWLGQVLMMVRHYLRTEGPDFDPWLVSF